MHAAAGRDWRRLFAPSSVAVVGASDGRGIPGLPLRFLRMHGFPGRLYPVNPRLRVLDGSPCYPSVAALPEVPDLALVMTAAARVPALLEECGAAGVPFVAVCGSGFAEAGDAGARAQAEVAAIAARHGIGLLGPNCQGLMNLPGRVFAGFSSAFNDTAWRAGGFSLVSQSGFGFGIAGLVEQAGVGVSKVVALGNAAGLDVADLVEALAEDAETRAIGLFFEGLPRRPRRLLEAGARAAASGKPVLAWKAGATEGGRRAAAAHTAALAGDGALAEALLRKAGMIPVSEAAEMADLALAFGQGRRPRGRRLAVVTVSGGAGVAMADTAERHGVEIGPLGPETTAALRGVIPAFGSAANPVDVTAALIGQPDLLTRALDLVAADPAVDMVAVVPTVLQGEAARVVAEAAARAAGATGKPLVSSWCPRSGLADAAEAVLREAGVPNFPDPVRCVAALGALAAAPAAPAPVPCRALRDGPSLVVAEHAALALLRDAGVPTLPSALATSADEAADAARRFGGRLALKVQSPDLPHKSDAGAVALDVAPDGAAGAFARIVAAARAHAPGARIEGVLVQPMRRGVAELILGVRNDALHGPAVLVGLGGVQAEALGDARLALAPVDSIEAAAMLGRLRGVRLLRGFRGAPPGDEAAVVAAICALSEYAVRRGHDLETLEVNPLLVLPRGEGVVALDALATLRTGGGAA